MADASTRFPVVDCCVEASEAELLSTQLLDLGTNGIEELALAVDDPPGWIRMRAGFPSMQLAHAALSAIDPRWRPRVDVIVGDEWMDAWREHFEPFRVGRLVVVPSYRGDADLVGHPVLLGMGLGDVVVHLDPGRSFGTGAHPSTRLVLEALQELPLVGSSVLDVGCGSGILAIAALLLGASTATATDIDDAARETTARNAADNGVAARCSVTSDGFEADTRYDVVVANILAPVLVELAPTITRAVRPGGVLVLSGLIDTQQGRVLGAYPHFAGGRVLTDDPWTCLVLRRGA